MPEQKADSTNEILLILCKSVQKVLKKASAQEITFSPLVQKINKTCLKPDIGCFTVFEGGISGLLIMNFSAKAALDIYRSYMLNMGMPEDELSILHTSDDVADVLGELMNQTMGHFQTDLRHELHVSVNQNQPKMLVINKDIHISIDTQIDNPQYRRVSFETERHRPFYLELGIEKTIFEPLFPFEKEKHEDIEDILTQAREKQEKEKPIKNDTTEQADDDFMKEIGL
ncbi:MAG: DUF3334 family protein [Thermodesulfobacteriota bacterium]|nr:DUF3334 family protein [Thermodesulfobacteriota bacterium]